MRLPWRASAPLLFAIAFGCSATPFKRTPLPVLNNPNPPAMRDGFAGEQTNRFTSDDTIVIQAPFRDDLAFLAVIRVDREANTFELVGLSQLGVTLFDLSGNSTGTTLRFAVPPLQGQSEVLRSIGQDIGRIYLDLVPSSDSAVHIGQTLVCFTQKTPQGKLVYEFGGNPTVLVDKHLDGFFGAVWRVQYFEYSAQALGLYPHGIVMDNNQYHYRIIVKNRSRAAQ